MWEVFTALYTGPFPWARAPLPQSPQLVIFSLLYTQLLSHLHSVPSILNLPRLSVTLHCHPISFFLHSQVFQSYPHKLLISSPSIVSDSAHCDLVSTPVTPLFWLESPDAPSSGHASLLLILTTAHDVSNCFLGFTRPGLHHSTLFPSLSTAASLSFKDISFGNILNVFFKSQLLQWLQQLPVWWWLPNIFCI